MAKNDFFNQKLTDDSIKEFIQFPLESDSKGKLKVIRRSIDAVKLFINNFFNTPYQSRVMESNLGTRVHRFLGYPLTEETKRAISEQVEKEIRQNFKVIRIINIEVGESDRSSVGFKMHLQLDYKKIFRDEYFNELDSFDSPLIELDIDIVQ